MLNLYVNRTKIALLPGKTQLFNLAKDPGETTESADNPEIVKDLEARLLAYAKEQKPICGSRRSPPSSVIRARR